MKATYDRRTDTLTLVLRDDVKVAESDEDKPGVILTTTRTETLYRSKCWMPQSA